jgi:hypothetical protein
MVESSQRQLDFPNAHLNSSIEEKRLFIPDAVSPLNIFILY